MRRILLITARMHRVTRITLRTSPMMRVMIPTQRIVLLTASDDYSEDSIMQDTIDDDSQYTGETEDTSSDDSSDDTSC